MVRAKLTFSKPYHCFRPVAGCGVQALMIWPAGPKP
jgi:hypothetical protein